jgi:hypothetical protein
MKTGAWMMSLASLAVSGAAAAQGRASAGLIDAVIPLQMQAVDPVLGQGKVWSRGIRWDNPRIALQPARAADAIVTVEGRRRTLVLAVTEAAVLLPNGLARRNRAADVWCELQSGRVFSRCFSDADRDGRLDHERIGANPAGEELGVTALAPPRAIPPVAYRAARPDELPAFEVGYASCGSGLPDLRFPTLVRRVQNGRAKGSISSTECTRNAVLVRDLERGAKLYRFDRFEVAVTPSADGTLTTSLVTGIAPGTLIGPVRRDRALADADLRRGLVAETLARREEPDYLTFTAEPALTAGMVAPGETLASGPVVHAITGRLASALRANRLVNAKELLATGTPLFGVHVVSTNRFVRTVDLEPEILWCAPLLKDGLWTKRCLMKGTAGYTIGEGGGGFVIDPKITGFSFVGQTVAPVVERQPVNWGAPLQARLVLGAWARRTLELVLHVAPQGGAAADEKLSVLRASDGSATFRLDGAVMRLVPTADQRGATIELSGSASAGTSAVPE